MTRDVQFNLRIPENLKEKIKESAKQSGRSINGEAQYRLEKSFEPEFSETIEYQLMKQAYLDQSKQIKALTKLVEQALQKPKD